MSWEKGGRWEVGGKQRGGKRNSTEHWNKLYVEVRALLTQFIRGHYVTNPQISFSDIKPINECH